MASYSIAVRTEGGLLPIDLLRDLAQVRDRNTLPGLNAADYYLGETERLNEAIARAWNRLAGQWREFRRIVAELPPDDAAQGETRARWLLPLFQGLEFGRLVSARQQLQAQGHVYDISHEWAGVPLHLVGWNVRLDTLMTGVRGAARTAPSSLVQQYLNAVGAHGWGIVTNGRTLRLLRDSTNLVRACFVEFDLEAIFDGPRYEDFKLLWLLVHPSRFETRPDGSVCYLEQWVQQAHTLGAQVLDELRDGARRALEQLGNGFLLHPDNHALRRALRQGALTPASYGQQLMRLLYRLIFLLVVEERGDLLNPDAGPAAQERYMRFYSLKRLRDLAWRRGSERHYDLWEGQRLVLDGLDKGEAALALPALGSQLWDAVTTPDLQAVRLTNSAFLAAIHALTVVSREGRPVPIDFANLRPDALGGLYESLLELHAVVGEGPTFGLREAAGHVRKTTGAYYTPEKLVAPLLDSALKPLLDEAVKGPDPEKALLNLTVCDPACGSGHFLLAAGHRIAARLARVRAGHEPTPPEVRQAMRDVVANCLFGVDINPLAVEICQGNLWLQAMEPGKSLPSLKYHIVAGNALLGATPALLQRGIPAEAFGVLPGDDPARCRELKARNKAFRESGQFSLLNVETTSALPDVRRQLVEADAHPAVTRQEVLEKEEIYRQNLDNEAYKRQIITAHAWCAAFVQYKTATTAAITSEELGHLAQKPPHITAETIKIAMTMADEYNFFHWHLAFPQIFWEPAEGEAADNPVTGWNGGFSLLLGNPPWDRVKLQEKEWFAQRSPAIANAPNAAARQRLIQQLKNHRDVEVAQLYFEFEAARRRAEGESRLLRESGRYPLTGRGDVNTYAVFAELMRMLVAAKGRHDNYTGTWLPAGHAGFIVPSGIATDDTTKHFFADLIQTGTLKSLYDFENRAKLFPGVHSSYKFSLVTVTSADRPNQDADFVFFADDPNQLRDPERHLTLSAADIELINPNTFTCPIIRTSRDAALLKRIHRQVPVLHRENVIKGETTPVNIWGVSFTTLFHMSNDSGYFRTKNQLISSGGNAVNNRYYLSAANSASDGQVVEAGHWLPLYEAKLFHHFDHRWATYAPDAVSQASATPEVRNIGLAEKMETSLGVTPRYWLSEWLVQKAATQCPPTLAKAVDSGRSEEAEDIVAKWLVGWHEAQQQASTVENLAKQYPVVSATAFARATKLPVRTRQLIRDYPLTAADSAMITAAVDVLSASKALIIARCPRWFIAFRDICRSTDERTGIFSVLPFTAISNTAPVLEFSQSNPMQKASFLACINSLCFDYVIRQKIGGIHLTFGYLKQLPALPPATYDQPCPWAPTQTVAEWIRPRVLELVYTTHDLRPFAEDLGYDGEPFIWNEYRRRWLRAELDAAFFHLYGLDASETEYVLSTFPIVQRQDTKHWQHYFTQWAVRLLHGQMQLAQQGMQAYPDWAELDQKLVLLAAYCATQLATAGRPANHTLMMKALALVLLHVAPDLDPRRRWVRQKAGPYDKELLVNLVDAELRRQGLCHIEEPYPGQSHGAFRYEPRTDSKEWLTDFHLQWTEHLSIIDKIVGLLRQGTTQEAEVLATLYFAWNDLLLQRPAGQISDENIIEEAGPAKWHANKGEVPVGAWKTGLAQLRQAGLTPSGTGILTASLPQGLANE